METDEKVRKVLNLFKYLHEELTHQQIHIYRQMLQFFDNICLVSSRKLVCHLERMLLPMKIKQ